ncbi:MAG: 1-acyl-sn-glycerol-3-phosphate acyltransferase [Pseudomonadales bacterium]|nr:1-acyl-sn-glycerol-3-phosphate acyltransferase [Pseudomonadales bacterium]
MKGLSRWLLRRTGWRIQGAPARPARYILVAAPHTSNWDLLWLLLMAWATDIPISWLGKHSLFRWPLGVVLRALGGVPVVRHRREDRVASTAATFATREEMVLVIPPEGTRSRTDYWKSGFYHIARTAGVPVVPTALDYARKVGEFGAPVSAEDDVVVFMDAMRAFYADRSGRYPERFGPVRLREESASTVVAASESA